MSDDEQQADLLTALTALTREVAALRAWALNVDSALRPVPPEGAPPVPSPLSRPPRPGIYAATVHDPSGRCVHACEVDAAAARGPDRGTPLATPSPRPPRCLRAARSCSGLRGAADSQRYNH